MINGIRLKAYLLLLDIQYETQLFIYVSSSSSAGGRSGSRVEIGEIWWTSNKESSRVEGGK